MRRIMLGNPFRRKRGTYSGEVFSQLRRPASRDAIARLLALLAACVARNVPLSLDRRLCRCGSAHRLHFRGLILGLSPGFPFFESGRAIASAAESNERRIEQIALALRNSFESELLGVLLRQLDQRDQG